MADTADLISLPEEDHHLKQSCVFLVLSLRACFTNLLFAHSKYVWAVAECAIVAIQCCSELACLPHLLHVSRM